MAKAGRKPLPTLDLEGRNKIFQDLRKFLNTRIGKRKKYALIFAYQGESKSATKECQVHTQTFSNLDGASPLMVWKVMLMGLMTSVQKFVEQYNLGNGVAQSPDGLAPKPPENKN